MLTDNVFLFLWKYLARRKVLFFSVIALIICGEFFVRVSMYYSSQIIEAISLDQPRADIFHQAIFLSLLAAASYLLYRLSYDSMTFIEAHFLPTNVTLMSKDLFKNVYQHSMAFFAEEMSGNVSGKVQTINNNAYNIYYHITWGFIYPFISLVITLAFIFAISPSLAFLMLVFSLIYAVVVYHMSKKVAAYSEKRSKASSEAEGVLVDSISNAIVVKSFSNYNYEKKQYFAARKKYAQADKEETIKYAWFFVYNGFLQSVIQITFFILPVWYWYQGLINIGNLVLLMSLISMIIGLSHHFSQNFSGYFKQYGGIKDGLKLLSKPYSVTDAPHAKELTITKGAISFDHITYHYKGSHPLFTEFDLTIQSGEKMGLVGHSGSGKSTLVKILSRYYDLQAGKILIDNQDITQVTQDSLRRNIALIPQDPSLFNRSILENIRYGNLRATDDEVYAAAQKAYIHDFIMDLPEGYNSKVGERGVMLSGGERQRIAIARAILKNAPILILDEATSALDSDSERYIQDSMKDLMQGKTVIAIAHRLSTLKEMDRIVVMAHGQIVETGSHEELLRKKGQYYKFYEMQSKGFLKL